MATIVRVSRLMVLMVAFMMLVAPSMARANDGPGHDRPALIGGIVVDRHGDPVAGAHVVLTRRGDGAIQRATTNDEGRFRFDLVRHGVYVVRASKDGVGHGARRVFARPGRNFVRIRLH